MMKECQISGYTISQEDLEIWPVIQMAQFPHYRSLV